MGLMMLGAAMGTAISVEATGPEAEAALTQSLLLEPAQASVIQHYVHLRQKQCSWPVFTPVPGLGQGEDPAQPIFEFATEESMRRGLFGGTPMTFIDGQDVDVPAYIRKAVRLPPVP